MDIGRQQRVIRVEPLAEPEMAPAPARPDEPAPAAGRRSGGRHGSARRGWHRARPILEPREKGEQGQGDE